MSTTDKYDRQLRLWGPHGQQKLGDSQIVLLNCDPAGVEAVKNLVLPGVGEIIVVDNKVVTARDATNNFFTPMSHLGQHRAKVVQQFLCELNPEVRGQYLVQDPQTYQFTQQCTLVIANEFTDREAYDLSKRLALLKIKVIFLNTRGFIGKIRLQASDHFIIESKPMGLKMDLRIARPFHDFMMEAQISLQDLAQDPDKLAHVPYIIILRKALEQYMAENNGNIPRDFKEKQTKFRQIIENLSKLLPPEYRENFMEGLDNIQQTFADFRLSTDNQEEQVQNIMTLFEDPRVNNPQETFWVLVAALKEFSESDPDRQPPLPRMFPDMKCTTETYIKMKRDIYGKKSDQDFEKFKMIVQSLIKIDHLNITIKDDLIRLFIDNVLNLKIVQFRSYWEELDSPKVVDDFETELYKWYIIMRAAEKLHKEISLKDVDLLNEASIVLAQQMKVDPIDIKYCQEYCRYEDCKLHVIASQLGGIASQEAVKLITSQFVPINNTLILNGLTGESGVYLF